MANSDITDEEWLELYRHLLLELEKRGFNEVREEIEAAASAPMVEESTPEDQVRISNIVSGEVGKASIRRRNPEEVFEAATGVLQSRLIELPAIAGALVKHLGVPNAEIEFRIDYEQRYALVESTPVPLASAMVTEQEERELKRGLAVLRTITDAVKE